MPDDEAALRRYVTLLTSGDLSAAPAPDAFSGRLGHESASSRPRDAGAGRRCARGWGGRRESRRGSVRRDDRRAAARRPGTRASRTFGEGIVDLLATKPDWRGRDPHGRSARAATRWPAIPTAPTRPAPRADSARAATGGSVSRGRRPLQATATLRRPRPAIGRDRAGHRRRRARDLEPVDEPPVSRSPRTARRRKHDSPHRRAHDRVARRAQGVSQRRAELRAPQPHATERLPRWTPTPPSRLAYYRLAAAAAGRAPPISRARWRTGARLPGSGCRRTTGFVLLRTRVAARRGGPGGAVRHHHRHLP